MNINRKPVTSSNIVSMGYDPASQTMEIEFKGKDANKVYRYSGVPAETFAKFETAESVGAHFAREIRTHFDGVLQTPPEPVPAPV